MPSLPGRNAYCLMTSYYAQKLGSILLHKCMLPFILYSQHCHVWSLCWCIIWHARHYAPVESMSISSKFLLTVPKLPMPRIGKRQMSCAGHSRRMRTSQGLHQRWLTCSTIPWFYWLGKECELKMFLKFLDIGSHNQALMKNAAVNQR